MDFGFKLSPSSAISLDRVDRSLYERLVALEPDAKVCMACGSCSATCTAGALESFEARTAASRPQSVPGMIS